VKLGKNMVSNYLVEFKKEGNKVDGAEAASNFLLTPLRLACGKTVEVTVAKNPVFLEQRPVHPITKFFLGLIAVVLFPLTLLGILCSCSSRTHEETCKEYAQSLKRIPSSAPQLKIERQSPQPKPQAPKDALPAAALSDRRLPIPAREPILKQIPMASDRSLPQPKIEREPSIPASQASPDLFIAVSNPSISLDLEQQDRNKHVSVIASQPSQNLPAVAVSHPSVSLDFQQDRHAPSAESAPSSISLVKQSEMQVPSGPFTNIQPQPRIAWENTIHPRSREEICRSLDDVQKDWYRNNKEEVVKAFNAGKPTPGKKSYAELNKEICAYVKQQRPDVRTPMDFLESLQGRPMAEPVPILNEEGVQIEEGEFYEIHPFLNPAYRKVDRDYAVHMTYVLKKEKGQLCLFLQGFVQGVQQQDSGLWIHDQFYSFKSGRGLQTPSYLLKEGDAVFLDEGDKTRFCFQVGKNGTLLFAEEARCRPSGIDEDALNQSRQFSVEVTGKTRYPVHYTSHEQAAELTFIRSGFSAFSNAKHRSSQKGLDPFGPPKPLELEDIYHVNDSGELLFVDIEQDKILRDLAIYLRTEFEVMQYTQEQQAMRLASLASTLFQLGETNKNTRSNYYLGEVVRSGGGVCRHRGLLMKALADQLMGYNSGLVYSFVPLPVPWIQNGQFLGFVELKDQSAHVWIVMKIKGLYWIIDAMNHCAFPVDKIPGQEDEYRRMIARQYGIPQHLIEENQKARKASEQVDSKIAQATNP
jgi:hypothetical protein